MNSREDEQITIFNKGTTHAQLTLQIENYVGGVI